MGERHSEGVPLAIEVRSKRFDPDTDRAKAAAVELSDLLRVEFKGQLPRLERGSESKGDPVTIGAILLALVTSGAVVKALECIKTWIDRAPDDRELRLTGKVGDQSIDLVVTARNVGDKQVAEVVRSLAENHLGG